MQYVPFYIIKGHILQYKRPPFRKNNHPLYIYYTTEKIFQINSSLVTLAHKHLYFKILRCDELNLRLITYVNRKAVVMSSKIDSSHTIHLKINNIQANVMSDEFLRKRF